MRLELFRNGTQSESSLGPNIPLRQTKGLFVPTSVLLGRFPPRWQHGRNVKTTQRQGSSPSSPLSGVMLCCMRRCQQILRTGCNPQIYELHHAVFSVYLFGRIRF